MLGELSNLYFQNCEATNETRNAPKLTDPKALSLLQEYCPNLYNGNIYI